MKFVSIILTHFAVNEKRSELLRKSLESLFQNTTFPYELIVVDNGGNEKDSQWLLELTSQGKINTYIRNTSNMHFGYARNQGLRLCNGDYIAIVDDDIWYYPGWLEACIKVLDAYPDRKIYATPVYNVSHWLPRFWLKEVLEVGGEIYRLNARAGSNCFVIRRRDFEEIGEFLCHRVAGTKWTEEAIEKGYFAAVTPEVLIDDMAFREGYNFQIPLPIKITLSNGKEVYFNNDEWKRNNRGFDYLEQRNFNPKARIRFERNSD